SSRPGTQEVEIATAATTPRILALQFTSEDPALVPTLVEVHAVELNKAVLQPVERTTGRCDVPLPAGQRITLYVWIPGLGSWLPKEIDLGCSSLQHIVVPRPGTLTFEVESPLGLPMSRIQASLRMSTFGSGLRDLRRGSCTSRELSA